jgi:hemerythrin
MGIVWNDLLSIGVEEIDDQHKRIFDTFNVFMAACRAGHGTEKLNDLLWFLSSYVATHFANEERLMQKIGFPGYQEHHQRHTDFVAEIDKLMGRFVQEGPTEELVALVKKFISIWLTDHISVMDWNIGQYIKGQEK